MFCSYSTEMEFITSFKETSGMSIKQLGSSYLVGNDSTGSTVNDTDTAYRGFKDFLIWLDEVSTGHKIKVKAGLSGRVPQTVQVRVYQCSNLLSDPGDQTNAVDIDVTTTGTPWTAEGTITITGQGLYRVRIKPQSNDILFTVELQNIRWYSLECWEPGYNFYMYGRSSLDPTEQYFFIPKLDTDETVRVRLAGEHFNDRSQLEVYKNPDTEDETRVALCETYGHSAETGKHSFFDTDEISGTGLPSAAPGEVYKFKLLLPGRNPEYGEKQPSGNTWVRFSRNVVPYFANKKERLIYPIIHREFNPVLYAGEEDTYRAYLTVPRSSSIIPSTGNISIRVKGTNRFSSQYMASLDYTAPSERDKTAANELHANLIDPARGAVILAKSTDKVDAVYFVTKPVYSNPSWPSAGKVLRAYDDANGNPTAQSLDSNGRFTTVQTDNPETLATIDTNNMTAMGVLYSGCRMPNWFNQYPTRPDDARIQFLAIEDEPDAGPSSKTVDEVLVISPPWALKDIYDEYYRLKGKSSTKPFSYNFMHTIFLEEYSKGCDIISHDPFVKDTSVSNVNKIEDAVAEMELHNTGIYSAKKTILILWWWAPKSTADITDDTLFGDSFDKRGDVDGIGGYKFSSGIMRGGVINRLDTYDSQAARDLWTKIKEKNGTINPPPEE